jgi:transcriptional regulator with XRE-family HTH domain
MAEVNMTDKDVCKRIKELRQSMKLTQSQFAELVNMSEDSIGKIERGVTVPTVNTLYKIADSIKMPVERFLAPLKETRSPKSSKALSDFIKYLETRSPDDIEFIHDLAVKIFERRK